MSGWALTVSVAVLLLPSFAHADVPSLDQELCEVEPQQRDGSQCLGCQYGRLNDGQLEVSCDAAIDRGFTERCAFGGMWVRAVYRTSPSCCSPSS